MEQKDIRFFKSFILGENDQDQTDKQASDHRQWEKARRQHNPRRNRPEQKSDIGRILDGSAEPHDGKRAHHTQGQHDIAGHRQDQQGRDQTQGDQRHTETGGIHNACVTFFVNKENKQSHCKGQN